MRVAQYAFSRTNLTVHNGPSNRARPPVSNRKPSYYWKDSNERLLSIKCSRDGLLLGYSEDPLRPQHMEMTSDQMKGGLE